MRTSLLLLTVLGCHAAGPTTNAEPDAGSPTADAVDSTCPAGLAGAACVLGLYDQAAGCDPAAVAVLKTELDARQGLGPLWANGRALFRTETPAAIAGDWNGWVTTAMPTSAFCGTGMNISVGAVPTGFHTYKLARNDVWSLDASNPAFAYDDFAGNADGRNSVLDTPDSGRGHLIELPQACSTVLGNCRDVTAYLPAGYDALENAARTYPVLFMHDGQNVWDDHDCCFGHTGWEINVTLDAEISSGKVAPIVVIAAASTVARNDEYGLDRDKMLAFIDFQIHELQPAALAHVRHDANRVAIAGSSLGGLVAMELALRHPEIYGAAASLSGAFWPRMDQGTALRDEVPSFGKQALAVYVDSGGEPSANSDGAADTIEVRDELVTLGWQRSCAAGPSAVCYAWAEGATHDELAWKARAWQFLEFLFPA